MRSRLHGEHPQLPRIKVVCGQQRGKGLEDGARLAQGAPCPAGLGQGSAGSNEPDDVSDVGWAPCGGPLPLDAREVLVHRALPHVEGSAGKKVDGPESSRAQEGLHGPERLQTDLLFRGLGVELANIRREPP